MNIFKKIVTLWTTVLPQSPKLGYWPRTIWKPYLFIWLINPIKLTFFYAVVGANQPMCKDFFLVLIAQVKCQCVVATQMFVIELKRFFMDLKSINAFNIVYLQFWMQLNEKNSFFLHLNVIKNHYYEFWKGWNSH